MPKKIQSKIKQSDKLTTVESGIKTKSLCESINIVTKTGKEAEWIFKASEPKLAELEAMASNLHRLLGDTTLTPKVRVIAEGEKNTGVISKRIPGYTPIHHCSKSRVQRIYQQQKRKLAALTVSAHVLEENDLNGMNWGVDEGGQLVRIDPGQSLWIVACTFYAFKRNEFESDPREIARWHNAIYTPKEAFVNPSLADIENLPKLQTTKPYNWILDDFPGLEKLASNDEYNYWKFYYYSKLILLNATNLHAIIEAHTQDPLIWKGLERHLLRRIDMIKNNLLRSPQFRNWIRTHAESIKKTLLDDLTSYNQEFGESDRKVRRYESSLINIDDSLAAFNALVDETIQIDGKLCSDKTSADLQHTQSELAGLLQQTIRMRKRYPNMAIHPTLKPVHEALRKESSHVNRLLLTMHAARVNFATDFDNIKTALSTIRDEKAWVFRKGRYTEQISRIETALNHISEKYEKPSDRLNYSVGYILNLEETLESEWLAAGNQSTLPFSSAVNYLIGHCDLATLGNRAGCLFSYKQLSQAEKDDITFGQSPFKFMDECGPTLKRQKIL